MATSVTLNGNSYSIPAYNDTGYAQGSGNLSSYLIAVATGFLSLSGGTFTLTADANFGASFGLLALYFKSVSANIATAGVLRMANTDLIEWRNFLNNGNNTFGVDTSNQLVYNGTVIAGSTGIVPVTAGGTGRATLTSGSYLKGAGTAQVALQAVPIPVADGGTNSTGALSNNRVMTSVSGQIVEASAITAARILKSDANGIPTHCASTTSDTELGYVAGVTSAIQTQLNQLYKLMKYRKPVLQWVSITTVDVEGSLDGTSGDRTVTFSDGDQRTITSSTMYRFDITRNCALSGTKQSGLRATLSEATNTWYAIYAVKASDNSTDWVSVGDTLLPLQANFATLNSNFGTGSWEYLGMIRNGDNSGATGDILAFTHNGNRTRFTNQSTASTAGVGLTGTRLANSAGATSLTYTYASGTGTAQIPNHLTIVTYQFAEGSVASGKLAAGPSAGTFTYVFTPYNSTAISLQYECAAAEGVLLGNTGTSVTQDINLAGFVDGVLGVGSNPLL